MLDRAALLSSLLLPFKYKSRVYLGAHLTTPLIGNTLFICRGRANGSVIAASFSSPSWNLKTLLQDLLRERLADLTGAGLALRLLAGEGDRDAGVRLWDLLTLRPRLTLRSRPRLTLRARPRLAERSRLRSQSFNTKSINK